MRACTASVVFLVLFLGACGGTSGETFRPTRTPAVGMALDSGEGPGATNWNERRSRETRPPVREGREVAVVHPLAPSPHLPPIRSRPPHR
jgi:hypothetical protein